MPTVNDIVARLTLNAKAFTASFDQAVGAATARAKTAGGEISAAFRGSAGGFLQGFTSEIPVLGGALSSLSGPLLLASAGIGAVSAATAFAVSNSEEYAQATRQLDAVLKSTGNTTGLTTEQLKDFAEQQESAWAISAESILKAEQVLSTFDGVAGTTFKRAITSAADLAAVYGGDLAGNAEKLGVVLQNLAQGNVEGLSKAFKFLGTAQLETIAAMAKAGDGAAAQAALLDALKASTDGAAEAAGKGLTGAMFRLKDALGDTGRKFADNYGITDRWTSNIDNAASSVGRLGDKLVTLNGLQLTGEVFKYFTQDFNFASGGRLNGLVDRITGRGDAATGAGLAARDNILALDEKRQKAQDDEAARMAAARSKAEGDAARAAADKLAAAKKAADEAERAAKALADQRKSLNQSLADYEFQTSLIGKSREDTERMTVQRNLQRQYGPLLTKDLREQSAALVESRLAAEGLAEGLKWAADYSKQQQEETDRAAQASADQIKADAKAAADAAKAQAADDFRYLSNSFYDLFNSRAGSFWDRFKDLGARTLSELASQLIISGTFDLGSTSGGGLASLLGRVLGVGGSAGGSGLLSKGASLLGIGGAAAGAAGLAGAGAGVAVGSATSISASAAASSAIAAGAGGAAAGGGAASGALAALGAAAPWLAALAGLAAFTYAVVPKITPRSFQNLNTDAQGQFQASFGGARGSGKDALQTDAEQIAATFGQSLQSVLDSLGGKLQANATIGAIGPANGKFEFKTGNTTVDGYDRSGGTTQVFDTAQAAAMAGLQSVFQRGIVTGIDQSIVNLLKSGDFEAQSAKAVKLQSALKELNGGNDATQQAVKALTDQFAELRDIMAEAGSSAEDVAKASALYDSKLQDIRDSTGNATGTLKSFLNELGFGSSSPLSLADQQAAARANYDSLVGRIGTSGFDQGAFVSAGQRLLDIETQLSGRTQDFFSLFNQVQADTNRAISTIDKASGINGDNPFARRTADATAATADNTSQLLQVMQTLSAQIAGSMASGGSGGFIGFDNRGFVASVA